MALRNPHPYSATVDHVIPLNDGGSLLDQANPLSYKHLRAHETGRKLVCRLLP